MKKFFYGLSVALLIGIITFACDNSNESTKTSAQIPKSEVLKRIKSDIANHKYYPNVKNKYDYSAKNYREFITQNQALLNNQLTNPIGRDSVSHELYVKAVVDFYKDTDHTEAEIRDKFATSDTLIHKYDSDYVAMLGDFVAKGLMHEEEKDIVLSYLDYYYDLNDFEQVYNVSTVFTQYVNESDFTEFEKRGMLTVFDTFKENEKLFDDVAPFDYLHFIELAKVGPDGRPSRDTMCGGHMIVGMVGGALLGNGLGFVVGAAEGAWQCYCAGCFD